MRDTGGGRVLRKDVEDLGVGLQGDEDRFGGRDATTTMVSFIR